MGAEQFEAHSSLTDPAAAFREVVDQAAWEHGHGGYTGTIAEKDGYTVFPLPAGKTVDETVQALQEHYWSAVLGPPSWLLQRLRETYNDKWGPAVALQNEDGSWTFCGWASS